MTNFLIQTILRVGVVFMLNKNNDRCIGRRMKGSETLKIKRTNEIKEKSRELRKNKII